MTASLRARSSRTSAIARRVYAPAVPGQRLDAARAVVATMDVTQEANGLTCLLRRCPVSGAVVQRIPVAPDALPLLAYLRGDV
ncbi:MAG: hypothetical protein H0X24_14965 [Ktedonobacterales bacterium]|nr:hypothetical protein [Ktedonobacterales bacterium]